jgi:hypothetical protein
MECHVYNGKGQYIDYFVGKSGKIAGHINMHTNRNLISFRDQVLYQVLYGEYDEHELNFKMDTEKGLPTAEDLVLIQEFFEKAQSAGY